MSESSTKRADRAARVSAKAKAKKKKSSPLSASAAARGGKSDSSRPVCAGSLTGYGDSDDDEYDRSNVVFANGSGVSVDSDTELLRAAMATGTRVKFLWEDVKEYGDDAAEARAEARGSSTSRQRRGGRAQKPKAPPVPRSIQKRAPDTLRASSPLSPPPASLLPVAAALQFGVCGDSQSALLQRILTWEEELKARISGATTPPVPPSITNSVGSNALPMAFRNACAEIIKRYPQSASKMSIDKRLWVSWYKEIDALQAMLRSGSSRSRSGSARSPSPGTSGSSRASTDETTRKLQGVLASCTEFYASLVDELRKLHQRQQHYNKSSSSSSSKTQEQRQQHFAIRFSLHMSLVALGDTARYAQRVLPNHHGHDWSVAQQHYERALGFLPSNGKVYNQLALLAMTQREALKSVFLYARSLACETPFSSRENLVHAISRGRATDVEERFACSSIAEVQERVGALLLSCIDDLFAGADDEYGDRHASWDAITSSLLSGLQFYLETCTSLLLEGERLDVDRVRGGLNQIVCVLIFLVHYVQAPPNSAHHLSRLDFEQELTGWRDNADVERLLSLGFAVVTYVMKECAKAVLTAEFMVVAKDLMNMLLPPITVYLNWLRLHPWFVQGSEGVEAADFLSCTVNLLFSISASLLADRILDEDMSALSAQLLPEDRELCGFLPISSEAFSCQSDHEEDEREASDDDETLLDIRMCRVLSFSSDFLKLNGKVPTSEVSWKLQEQTATAAAAGSSVHCGLIVFEPSLETTESGRYGAIDSSGDDEVEILSDLLLRPSSFGSPPLARVKASASGTPATQNHAMRRGSPAHRRSPRDSSSNTRSTATTSSSSPLPEDSTAFAAVMAIGADKKLYDASANLQTDAQKCLVVIDAPNVAMRHGFGKKFSCKGIRLAFDYFLSRGHRVVGFLPDYVVDRDEVEERRRLLKDGVDVPAAKIPDNVELLQEMVEQGLLIPTPAQDYDDSYCIQYAGMYDGCVVTNDLYRDHVENMSGPRERKVAMRSWLVAHRISYTWVRNEFLPNPNFRYPKHPSQ